MGVSGNLDSVSETEVLKCIDVVHEQGKTVVIVTHSETIAKRAERVIYLEDGRIRRIA
jgi:putative ABC transport system ATP-binding protein